MSFTDDILKGDLYTHFASKLSDKERAECDSYLKEHLKNFENLNDVNYVKDILTKANHCKVDEDCTVAPLKCPFGCSNLVYRDKLLMTSVLLEWHPSKCEYKCKRPEHFKCIGDKCVITTP